MSDEPKKPLSETAFDRKLDARIKAIQDAQAARDAAQDAKLARPSVAVKAVDATLDITSKYPVAAWIMGTALVIGSLAWLDGVKLYIGCGVGVCFVPGLPKKVIGLFKALKNGNGAGQGGT